MSAGLLVGWPPFLTPNGNTPSRLRLTESQPTHEAACLLAGGWTGLNEERKGPASRGTLLLLEHLGATNAHPRARKGRVLLFVLACSHKLGAPEGPQRACRRMPPTPPNTTGTTACTGRETTGLPSNCHPTRHPAAFLGRTRALGSSASGRHPLSVTPTSIPLSSQLQTPTKQNDPTLLYSEIRWTTTSSGLLTDHRLWYAALEMIRLGPWSSLQSPAPSRPRHQLGRLKRRGRHL